MTPLTLLEGLSFTFPLEWLGWLAHSTLVLAEAYPRVAMHPNSLVMTMIGAGLLWVGWFGFNAGSSVESGLKTGQALAMTQIAAAAGALTWISLEGFLHKKSTSLGLVSGIISGLVAITPAAGDVLPVGALFLGVLGSLFSYGAISFKNRMGYDDTLDVFGIHGVAGIVGAIGLTFFLRDVPEAGMMSQLGHQVLGVIVAIVASAIGTLVLLVLLIRFGIVDERLELAGMDHSLHGEYGYGMLNPN